MSKTPIKEQDKIVATAEEKGRRKMERLFKSRNKIKRYYFEPDRWAKIDCFATADTKTEAVEIKDRSDKTMRHYPEWILQYDKYGFLMDAQKNSGYTPYYVNFFDNDMAVIWRVDKIKNAKERVEKRWMTETTVYDYGEKKVLKDVIGLKVEEGRIIDMKELPNYDEGRDN